MFATTDAVGSGSDVSKAIVFSVAPGAMLPELPATGIDPPRDNAPLPPNTRVVEAGFVSPGPGFNTYVFTKTDIQRNLFRIPLH